MKDDLYGIKLICYVHFTEKMINYTFKSDLRLGCSEAHLALSKHGESRHRETAVCDQCEQSTLTFCVCVWMDGWMLGEQASTSHTHRRKQVW